MSNQIRALQASRVQFGGLQMSCCGLGLWFRVMVQGYGLGLWSRVRVRVRVMVKVKIFWPQGRDRDGCEFVLCALCK